MPVIQKGEEKDDLAMSPSLGIVSRTRVDENQTTSTTQLWLMAVNVIATSNRTSLKEITKRVCGCRWAIGQDGPSVLISASRGSPGSKI